MVPKTCLVTGANSGIGKAAAIMMAQAGYHALIGCRNEARGIAALKEIRQESKSQAVELVLIDMASQRSIRDAVRTLGSSPIDVLIHNAADFDISRKQPTYSPENIETVWATNHIGPVLLTSLLVERLKESVQGRIITVASKGLIVHPFLKINMEDPEFKNGGYSVEKAYYQSKLAQVMYTYWLAKELNSTRVTANCIRVTNVRIDPKRYPNLSPTLKMIYSLKRRFAITPEAMAQTYFHLASSEAVTSITGKYFNEKNQIVTSSAYSKNPKNIEALMEKTREYLRFGSL